jgi:hypothetical protein
MTITQAKRAHPELFRNTFYIPRLPSPGCRPGRTDCFNYCLCANFVPKKSPAFHAGRSDCCATS